MKRIILIFLLIISLFACISKILSNSTEQTKTILEEEQFYGEWIIKKNIESNKISTYGERDIEKMIGKKITYSKYLASFNGSELKNPHFKKTTLTKKEYEENNIVNLKELGLSSEFIVSVEVYIDKEYKSSWEKPGSFFIIKDKDCLILIDNGEFFELTRNK